MIRGVNHITLAVTDLDRSLRFYRDVLQMRPVAQMKGSAYLLAGDLWLALVQDEGTRSGPLPEYTHVAFTVPRGELADSISCIRASGAVEWQEDRTEGASHYFLDPDGHKLEVHASDLESRLRALIAEPPEGFELL